MMNRYKTGLLAVPIAVVDIATFSNVFSAYRFFEHEHQALLAAMGFALLQIGSLVLYSQDLPSTMRRWLLAGVIWLLVATGLSNVAMAYFRGSDAFPAERLVPALGFGASADRLTVAAAWMVGLTLVAVGSIYWTVLGNFLHSEQARRSALQQDLQTYLKKERT